MGIQINGQTDTVTAIDGSLNVGGDVTIPGVLTYDDVTSVDSIGIVTARSGLHVTSGLVGIGTDYPTEKLSVGSTSAYNQNHGIGVYKPHSLGLKNGIFVYSDIAYNSGDSYRNAAFKAVGTAGHALGISTDAGIDATGGTNNAHINFDGSAYFGGNVGIGTDVPTQLITVGAAVTTALFEVKPHVIGYDISVSSGDLALHYQDNFVIYNGQPGSGTERFRITSDGEIQIKDEIKVTFGNAGSDDTRIYYSGANDFLDIGLKSGSKINIFNISDTDNYMQFYLESNTAQIGDTFSGTTDKQYIYFGAPNGSSDPGFIMHETRGAESNEGIIHLCPSDDNQTNDYVSIHGTNDADRIKLHTSGNISTPGSISKGSGSFSIPHPLAGLSTTNNLVHSFVEAPDASNLYAGMVDLVDGTATVNIDTAHRMTEGTFVALNNVQSWSSSNESGYSPVKCSISGNLLTIECQDTSSTDTVYYEVRGIRKDQHMIDAHWTDENGRVITEPLK